MKAWKESGLLLGFGDSRRVVVIVRSVAPWVVSVARPRLDVQNDAWRR